VPRDGLNRFCGHLDRYDDVLGSLPQEDRVHENRFRNHDLDGLQHEFGSFDERPWFRHAYLLRDLTQLSDLDGSLLGDV